MNNETPRAAIETAQDNRKLRGKDSNNTNTVLEEFQNLEQELHTKEVGFFIVKTANDTLRDAAKRPNPIGLWGCLWYEGEMSCLFADSNLGKSILAVEVATNIAKSQKVAYFDFELSDKQFQLRYTDYDGRLFVFPDNLFRVEIKPECLFAKNFTDEIIKQISSFVNTENVKVIIIDNITFLNSATEKGDEAGDLMIKLKALQKERNISMLIIAHTPKRCMTNPITPNDLAGSRKLYNFFDSCNAIGQSAKDPNLRYIKQLKVRYGAFSYGADNVQLFTIQKEGGFLHFVPEGNATEREHLKEPSEKDKCTLIEQAKTMQKNGLSQRQIAGNLGISLGTVNNYLKK